MSAAWAAPASALWLGILTAVSPCMMATTVAAISFISRRVGDTPHVVLSGAFYVLAQALTYMVLAGILVGGLLSTPVLSQWLRAHSINYLGPFMLCTAPFLLEWITLPAGRGRLKQWAQGFAARGGFGVAALLGMVFAMSFCPTTAALFFGGLVPLAVTHESALLLPLTYALGVSIPVSGFALLIAYAAHRVGQAFKRVSQVETWARRITGALFLMLGAWFTLHYTLEVL